MALVGGAVMGADVARVVAALLPATDPERVTAVLEAFDEAAVVQDDGGRFAFWNASAQRLPGSPGAGLPSRTWGDPRRRMVRPAGSALADQEQPAMLARGTGQPMTDVAWGVYRPDRVLTWLRVDAVPVPAAGLGGTAVVSRLVGR